MVLCVFPHLSVSGTTDNRLPGMCFSVYLDIAGVGCEYAQKTP